MRIVVSGGHGRLGKRLVPWLVAQGADVYAPKREELDWTNTSNVRVAVSGAARVVALASWTDVNGAQAHPKRCVRDTVATAAASVEAARTTSTRLRYVSSDYVFAVLRAQEGSGVYAASKLVAEQLVLLAGYNVARVSFVTEEQASRWTWVDGFSQAHRCWVDELVPKLGEWVLEEDPPEIVHLGGDKPTTLAELLAQRMPTHPALERVVHSSAELRKKSSIPRPADTTWGKPRG